jgi:hypothetical protein
MSKKNSIGIQVGANKEAISEARKSIIDILKSGQDQSTIQVALESFTAVTQVNGTNVSGCTITVKD